MTTEATCPVKNISEPERAVSTVGGAIIAGYGLAKLNAATPILLLLGGALIYRGVSGNCKLYEKIGVTTREDDADAGPAGMVWNTL
jgi:uncharacterized membrane protein